jgi:hypothetical protein
VDGVGCHWRVASAVVDYGLQVLRFVSVPIAIAAGWLGSTNGSPQTIAGRTHNKGLAGNSSARWPLRFPEIPADTAQEEPAGNHVLLKLSARSGRFATGNL